MNQLKCDTKQMNMVNTLDLHSVDTWFKSDLYYCVSCPIPFRRLYLGIDYKCLPS